MTTPRPTIRRVFMLTLAVLVTIAPLPATEVADEGTFEANWSLEGTQESVVLAGKSVAAYRLTGKVKVRVSDGLATEFASICAGISDQETGGMARCIWTDGEGAEIYLQLTGKIIGSMGTSRETQGKITGGYRQIRRARGLGRYRLALLGISVRRGQDHRPGYQDAGRLAPSVSEPDRLHGIDLIASTFAALVVACSSPPPVEEVSTAPLEHVGREACAGCHEAETELWTGSHHDLAMQEATPETILGDFDDATFTYAGVVSTFFRRDGKYLVETDGPDGAPTEYEIAYTFGVEPLQQYLIPFPDGRLQALNVVWDTRPAEEGGQHWYHLYPDEAIDHEDPLHWTGTYQNWNHACAECHSTEFRKGYDPESDRFESTWSEIDVSCETCHGRGSRHVAWAEAAERGEAQEIPELGLEVILKDRNDGAWVINAETGIAERTVARSSRQQVETCARCHARRSNLVEDYRHGRPLLDTHRPSLLEEALYHPDGQILDEVYVYGSFLQSKMYTAGVTCGDCHDPHGLTILSPDGICALCHDPDRFATGDHHFHPARSTGSSCIGCHMVSRDYMVIDGRRDHSFRVPRPDVSLRVGTPNACTGCHSDRSDAWSEARFEEWYGAPDETHYGETLALGRRGGPGANAALEALAADSEATGMVRATALALLARQLHPSSVPVVERALADSEPLVRFGAVQALRGLAPESRWRLGAPTLSDPVLAVRLEAVRELADVPPQLRAGADTRRFAAGVEELRSSLLANADRAQAQLALGTLAAQLGQPPEAEDAYRRAIELDPEYGPGYANLADLYRALGRDSEGTAVLQEGLERLPDDGSLRHAYGLLLVRQGRTPEALVELERAAELRPDIPRYGYVWAVAAQNSGQTEQAVEILEELHRSHPGDAEALAALVGYLRESGDTERAEVYAAKLEELLPVDVSR